VSEVTLKGKSQYDVRQTKYKVSEEIKTGEADDLFDFLAECVAKFLADSSVLARCIAVWRRFD
jgi:hexokinase